jgi:hypothetical protein
MLEYVYEIDYDSRLLSLYSKYLPLYHYMIPIRAKQ